MNKKHKPSSFVLAFGILFALALLLVACGSQTQQQANTETTPGNQVVLPLVDNSSPGEGEIAAKPTPRGNDLVATDPTTVSFASGQLQLVEMFAFW